MGEVEVIAMEPIWIKKWGNSSSEILDGFAFNSFSDATICCSGKRIPVHQMVLAASSDYFREILNSSMSAHPFIIFENVNLKSLEQLLMFIYRGQVFVRPQETRSLFRLAEEFKVKGLSGPVGSDMTTKYDFDPPGVDVLNLNLFRKSVNPTKIRDVDILRCKISSLVQKNPRKMRISESQQFGDFKVSKVKDNKYKVVGCNRTRIYDKEDASANAHQESPENATERDIFDQFSHISLVEDKSKTFTEEAVKDLVTRLTSHLNIKDQNQNLSPDASNQVVEVKQETEEGKQESKEQPQPTQQQELKLDTPFGISRVSSALEFSLTQQSMDGFKKYSLKRMNIPSEIAISPRYSCDFCSFTSVRESTYVRHRRLHFLERSKPILERFGKDERFINRIERLKNRLGALQSKSPLISYSSARIDLMERCRDVTSVNCTASTSQVNERSPLELLLGGGWKDKSLDSSSLRSHFQDICEFKKKFNPSSCSTKGHAKDNVPGQRYGRRHRRYICLYCSHKTYHKKNLIEHHKVHLQKTERKTYTCPNCPFKSHSELYLKIHQKSLHSVKTKNKSDSCAK